MIRGEQLMIREEQLMIREEQLMIREEQLIIREEQLIIIKNNKNIYLPPKNMSTVMLGTGDYMYSNSGNTKVRILKLDDN